MVVSGGGSDRVRAVVRILIAVLCGAALLLIVLILSGSRLDDTAGRAIWTAVALAFFSLTAVAGSNLANHRPGLALFGYTTVALSALAFMGILGAIWASDLSSDTGRAVGDAVVLAIASGHASLLLASASGGDSEAVRLTRTGTLLAMGLLSLLAIIEISSPGEDIGPKPIAVVAVLYVLGAILLPLLRRTSPGVAPAAPAAGAAPATGTGLIRIDHVVISVSDWNRADAFYGSALGGQRIDGPDGRVAYRLGEQQLNVHGPGTGPARCSCRSNRCGPVTATSASSGMARSPVRSSI